MATRLLLNPGSPTDRRRQPHGTYLTASVDAGRLVDVVLHAVEWRTDESAPSRRSSSSSHG